jgi:NAD(P)-dependent dehydrogenase (short-subunit alcohol dehydrogenase family)
LAHLGCELFRDRPDHRDRRRHGDALTILAGKVALVSGAGGGIGRAIPLAFAEAGAAVACCDIDVASVEETVRLIEDAGGRAIARRSDVAVEAETNAAAAAAHDAFGRLDILVSGAAPYDAGGTVLETSLQEWERVLAVNLTGSFLLSRAVLPRMIAGGGGSIILIASQLGRVGSAGRAVYCATKGALIQLAKVMAIDHAAQNIRVNTLSPGGVETQRTLRRYGSGARHLLGRLGRPREIAAAAVFLASDAASFVTGSDLLIDGGYTAV